MRTTTDGAVTWSTTESPSRGGCRMSDQHLRAASNVVLPKLAGAWSSGDDSDVLDVTDPATGAVIAEVPGAGRTQVGEAVVRAQGAFESWRFLSPRERGRYLRECAAALRDHADELAQLEALEMGKPYPIAREFDVEFCIAAFEYFGGIVQGLRGHSYDLGPIVSRTVHEPVGVVAGIIPFNWPPIHAAGKTAPALAVGNAVILKPPEQDPLTVMRIVELICDVLPEHLVQVLPGDGRSVGAGLVEHRGVRHVSFTGSTASGRRVVEGSAADLTTLSLELGGKNPFVVFEGADLELAVAGALEGAFFNQGEACTAASRILVHGSVHDEFVDRVKEAVPRLRVGPSLEPGAHVGPMVTKNHQQMVLSEIQKAIDEGAVVAASAPVPGSPTYDNGYWVAPTLFVGATPDMRIATHEIFGPVSAVLSFTTEAEAVRLVNSTDYGLVAAIYDENHARAQRVARHLDAGVVFINNYNRAVLGTPFGGMKDSGFGREHSLETMLEFTYAKNIREPSGIGEVPTWYALDDILE